MNRITRKLGCGSIEFVDGKGFANLSHSESAGLLFERLYAFEETGYSPEDIRQLQTEIDRLKDAANHYYLIADDFRKVLGAQMVEPSALLEVVKERARQDAKWGEQNHDPVFWLGILGEEFGELCQAINETVFDNGPEERKKGGYANMRAEAVQVAAVAVAFVEMLDRRYEEAAKR